MKKRKWLQRTGVVIGIAVSGFLIWQGVITARFYFGPSEATLAETGFDQNAARAGQLSNTRSFAPSYPFWSDGAAKERFISLPPGSVIDASNPDRWNFPVGTRLWKVFSRDEQLLETRMLFKFGPQAWDWDMAVYQPDQQGGQSNKLALSKENVAGTSHDIPAPSDCVSCHGDGETRRPLGLTAIQLPWSAGDDLSLEELVDGKRITPPPLGPYRIPGNALEQQALGYLDTNCGSCHLAGSTFVSDKVPLQMNLTVATLNQVESTNVYRTAINKAPHLEGMGLDIFVEPGQPRKSFLWRRMSVRDNGIWQMPPIATEILDEQGVDLIEQWISELQQ